MRKTKTAAVAAGVLAMLAGCTAEPVHIDGERALEIAVDHSDSDLKDLLSQKVSKDKEEGGYEVRFSTPAGRYVYAVHPDGRAVQKAFKKKDAVKEVVKNVLPNDKYDKNTIKAINTALTDTAVTQADVSGITCAHDADSRVYVVSFTMDDVPYRVLVDDSSFAIISSSVVAAPQGG